jgi:hypothetical protein
MSDRNKGRTDLPFFFAQQKKRIFVFAAMIAPARTHTTITAARLPRYEKRKNRRSRIAEEIREYSAENF